MCISKLRFRSSNIKTRLSTFSSLKILKFGSIFGIWAVMRGQRATTPEISNYSLMLWHETSTALIFFCFQLLAINIIVQSKQLIPSLHKINQSNSFSQTGKVQFNKHQNDRYVDTHIRMRYVIHTDSIGAKIHKKSIRNKETMDHYS